MASYKKEDILKIAKDLYARKRGTLDAPGIPYLAGRLEEAAKRLGGTIPDYLANRILEDAARRFDDPATRNAVEAVKRRLRASSASAKATVSKSAGSGLRPGGAQPRPGLVGGLRPARK